jgi:replicative DNA helicase
MSVESHVIASIVNEGAGALRKCYQAGVTAQDFVMCEEEFRWLEDRFSSRQPVNQRIFKRKFPDFEYLPTDERLQDLLNELKNETAYTQLRSLLETMDEELDVENAVQKAEAARDILSQITRQYAPVSDFALVSGWREHLEEAKRLRKLRQAGIEPGIPTGLKHIDFHWDGLIAGRMVVVLGRPGEGKSFLTEKFGAHAVFSKYRVLKFSPEMNRHEHTCRFHTLLSAYPEVKAALGMENSFRNRALMKGIGYNMKTYKRFLEYVEAEMGEMILMTATHRHRKMSPAFIEAKIADLAPDLVIIDPIYKLHPVRARMSRVEELSEISDAIQDLAETYNVPVVVTNQAHRQMSGKDDAPHKDSSFNSDVPIQEADHVIGVKNMSEEKRMILRCSKSRFGQDFRFELKFYPNTGVMKEVTEPTGSYMNGADEDVEDEELKEIVAAATRPQKRGRKKEEASA